MLSYLFPVRQGISEVALVEALGYVHLWTLYMSQILNEENIPDTAH